jgi:hypothetical protein
MWYTLNKDLKQLAERIRKYPETFSYNWGLDPLICKETGCEIHFYEPSGIPRSLNGKDVDRLLTWRERRYLRASLISYLKWRDRARKREYVIARRVELSKLNPPSMENE